MDDVFLGQILLVAFNFQPTQFAFCDGRLLSVSQNAALFALLGNVYGGNGTQTFALPDLRSRVPVGMGQGVGLSAYTIGQQTGTENVTLSLAQMPTHNHGFVADGSTGTTSSPSNGNIAQINIGSSKTPNLAPSFTTGSPAAPATLNPSSVQNQGGGQSHSNIQPVLALNYIIALTGIFPSRS